MKLPPSIYPLFEQEGLMITYLRSFDYFSLKKDVLSVIQHKLLFPNKMKSYSDLWGFKNILMIVWMKSWFADLGQDNGRIISLKTEPYVFL